MKKRFFRYGTRRYVGYGNDLVALNDVDHPNHLKNCAGWSQATVAKPVYWIDWEKLVCQAVWFVHFSDHIRMHSRVVSDWEASTTSAGAEVFKK